VKGILEDDCLEAFKPLLHHSAGWELPVHFAIIVGSSPEVVDILLMNNANANDMDSSGLTPLCMIACARLAGGTRDRADTHPMDELPAWLRHDSGSIGALCQRPRAESCPGAFTNTTHEAIWKHFFPPMVMQNLRTSGENQQNQNLSLHVEASMPLMSRMTDHRSCALAQVLLNHGADPSQRDKSGMLPGEYAALRGHDALVSLFAEHRHGAEPETA